MKQNPDPNNYMEIDEYLEFLKELKKEKNINMFRAVPWLTFNYKELTEKEAIKILGYYLKKGEKA